jgi:hydrogenase maturation protease
MSRPRLLVAGIGNIFLGDDAFGVEVARRLEALGLPECVHVCDFGIRGLDLAYALLDEYEAVILVDALPRGGPPGTLSVLELPAVEMAGWSEPTLVDGHNLDPSRVLRLASSLGARVGRVILVGCEPRLGGADDGFGTELSAEVREAVDAAIPLITSLVGRLLRGEEDPARSERENIAWPT